MPLLDSSAASLKTASIKRFDQDGPQAQFDLLVVLPFVDALLLFGDLGLEVRLDDVSSEHDVGMSGGNHRHDDAHTLKDAT